METTIEVLTPAVTQNLMSLADVKAALGIAADNIDQDPLINLYIAQNSGYVAALANRSFGRETVRETFWDFEGPRVYLSRYPVKQSDIVNVFANDVEMLPDIDYILEPESGKLRLIDGGEWAEPVEITYTGGYNLPTEAPDALKMAVMLPMQDKFTSSGTLREAGIRMVSHKETRVMYYQAGSETSSGGGAGGSLAAIDRSIQALIKSYIRIWA